MTVYGCSLDDVSSVAEFAKQEQLPFDLLSDPDGSTARRYNALGGRFPKRWTFLLDEEGILRHVEKKVLAASHGTDVVEIVRSLKK